MTALGDTGGSAATITQILTGLGDLLDAIHEARGAGLDSSLADTLSAHLGVPADSLAVTKEEIEGHRYVDLDIALADIAGRDPAATVIGVGGGDMRYHHSLGDLVASRCSAPTMPLSPTSWTSCGVAPSSTAPPRSPASSYAGPGRMGAGGASVGLDEPGCGPFATLS